MPTIWETLPPEVSSAMLSTGPGPGSLLAAGAAWRGLAVQYADAASQLTGILAAVQGGVWEGPSAEQYVAAHQPFCDWLTSMGSVAEVIAQRHDTVVAAYTVAVAGMPTLAELAANHAVHAGLLATNFLGLNTIPIALNEADYGRMWVQAAAAMRVYEGVSMVSVESSPTASPAPVLMSADSAGSARAASAAAGSGQFTFRDPAGVVVEQVRKLVNALAEWARDLPEPLRRMATQALDGAAAAVNAKLFSILTYSVLDPLIYFGPFAAVPAPAAAAAAASVGVPPADLAPDLAPGPVVVSSALGHNDIQDHSDWPAAGTTSAGTAPSVAPQSGSAPAPSAPATPMAPAPDVPYLYAVGIGPDGEGSAPTVRGAATQVVSAPVQEPVAASVAVAERRAARRRRTTRQHRHETMAADGRMTLPGTPAQPDVIGPRRDAGFGVSARGLVGPRATVTSDVVRQPMLPSTWTGPS